MSELSESVLKEAEKLAKMAGELKKDRDDWKAIAEMNSDIIDNLRKDVNELLASERDNREKI